MHNQLLVIYGDRHCFNGRFLLGNQMSTTKDVLYLQFDESETDLNDFVPDTHPILIWLRSNAGPITEKLYAQYNRITVKTKGYEAGFLAMSENQKKRYQTSINGVYDDTEWFQSIDIKGDGWIYRYRIIVSVNLSRGRGFGTKCNYENYFMFTDKKVAIAFKLAFSDTHGKYLIKELKKPPPDPNWCDAM